MFKTKKLQGVLLGYPVVYLVLKSNVDIASFCLSSEKLVLFTASTVRFSPNLLEKSHPNLHILILLAM